MHTSPSGDERGKFCSDADMMMTISKGKMKDLKADEADHIYAERTQVKFLIQIEETPIDVLQLGNNTASNGIESASSRFLKTILIQFFSRWAVDDIMSQCFDR